MKDSENLRFKRNLTALVEFSRIINSNLDLDFILSNVLLTCMGKFFATKGLIALKQKNELKISASKGLSKEVISNFPKIDTSSGFNENEDFNEFIKLNEFTAVERINTGNECLGIICLGHKLNKSEYSEDDLEFLRTILNIASTAIQNSLVINELKKVNRVLDSRIQRLNSLFELSKEFGLFSESTKVAKLLIYSVIGQFLVSKFAVITFDGNEIEILENKFDKEELNSNLKSYNFNKLHESIKKEEINKTYPELNKLNIELIVPMQIQGKTKGLILLGSRINKMDFSPADIEFIYSVGSLAIISLENKRLFQEALEKQKIEEELEIARDIQKNLLPHYIPDFENFEVAAFNLSSNQVGGDYYDIIPLDEDNFLIAIADVSGKGVPAALLMANLQAFLKITCRHNMQLSEATALINDLISENTSDGKFITFFWGIFNVKERKLSYVNAGHNPPLLIRDDKIKKLELGGIILGVMKTFMPYQSETIQLKENDKLILFTDGITEAMNKKGEEYSDVKLESLVMNFNGLSAKESLSQIRDSVKEHTQGTSQSDDITLIVIRVK